MAGRTSHQHPRGHRFIRQRNVDGRRRSMVDELNHYGQRLLRDDSIKYHTLSYHTTMQRLLLMVIVGLIRSVSSFTSSLYTARSLLALTSSSLVASSSSPKSTRSSTFDSSCQPINRNSNNRLTRRSSSTSFSYGIMSKSVGSLEVVQFPCLNDNYG